MNPAESLEESPFVDYLSIEVIRAEPGYGKAVMELDDCHAGPPGGGIAHGGAISAFADTVAGAAKLPLAGSVTPTVDLRIDYLRSADGETLHGTAETRREGRDVITVDIEMTDENDREIATGRGVFKTGNHDDQSDWDERWKRDSGE